MGRIMDSLTIMIKRLVVIFTTIAFAFLILFISVLRSASVRHSFSNVYADNTKEEIQRESEELDSIEIDYYFAHPGSVLPDHLLWPVKASRDINCIEGKEALREEIMDKLNNILTEGSITNIFFAEFVIH